MANRSTPGPPSLATLFLSFLTIGSTSFGGGLLGWIRRELVERRGWIDDQQFLVCYGISQMVPGATNVNLSVIIGTQLRGVPGALRRGRRAAAGAAGDPAGAGHALLRDARRVRAADCSTPAWPAPAPPRSASTSRPASGSPGATSAASDRR